MADGAATPKKQGGITTIFSLATVMIGSTIITLPWVIAQAGLVLGLVLVLLSGYVACYTASLILKNGFGYIDFAFRCQEVLGKWSFYLAQFISILVLLVAQIAFHIFLSQNFHQVINAIIDFSHGTVPHWWTPKIAALIIAAILLPLVVNPYPEIVIRISSYGIVAVLTVAVIVIVKGVTPPGGIDSSTFDYAEGHFPSSIGVLSMSFFIHNIVSSMFINSEKKYAFRDLFAAYTIDIVIYAVVGTCGYLGYHRYTVPGSDPPEKKFILDNFLLMFDSTNIPAFIARLFLVIQMLVSFPVVFRTMRVAIFSTFFPQDCFSFGTCCNCKAAHKQYMHQKRHRAAMEAQTERRRKREEEVKRERLEREEIREKEHEEAGASEPGSAESASDNNLSPSSSPSYQHGEEGEREDDTTEPPSDSLIFRSASQVLPVETYSSSSSSSFVHHASSFLIPSGSSTLLVSLPAGQEMSSEPEANFWIHVLPSSILLLSIPTLFAVFYPSVGTVLRFAGSFCGFVYIYLLPCLVDILCSWRARRRHGGRGDRKRKGGEKKGEETEEALPLLKGSSLEKEEGDDGQNLLGHDSHSVNRTRSSSSSACPQESPVRLVLTTVFHVFLIVYGAAVIVMQFVFSSRK